MLKIGIMTMHRVINYGSYLQAYALKNLIEKNINASVEFIDFKYERTLIEKIDEISLVKKLKDNKDVINYIKKKFFLNNVSKSYNDSLELLGVTNINYNHDIDVLVIGSDEVFNCMQGYPVGYSPILFGKTYENTKVVSYAASFGHTRYEQLLNYSIDEEVSCMLRRFKALSVRDDNSRFILEKLGITTASKNLDPVLVYDFSEVSERKLDVGFSNYVIIYAYTSRLSTDEERAIKRFARKYKKKIISVGYYSKIADQNIICNPLDIFEYFNRADYIITDTFHGTIFSIKTNSKFCTIIRDSNKNKITDLLNTLERSDRIACSLNDIEVLYGTEIDYSNTNQIIENERQKSVEYLISSIEP